MRSKLLLNCVFFLLISISIVFPEVIAEDYYKKGRTLLKHGNSTEAIAEFEKTISENPLMIDAYYGLAVSCLLENQLEKSCAYFNKGISIDRRFESNSLKAEELLKKNLRPYGFSENELQEKFLNIQDIKYIARCFLYKKITDNIVKGQKLSLEKQAEKLFKWTVRNIAQDAGREDFPALPLDIMLRGYGVCDRSAWVLTVLARQLGIKGGIFYLIDPKEKISPHTVALLYLNNEWCVFDPYKEVILKSSRDGSSLGIDEILKNPLLVKKAYPKDPSFIKAFEEGILWIPGTSRGYFPKLEIIEKIINGFIEEAPVIFWDLSEEIDFAIRTFLNPDSISRVTSNDMLFQTDDKKVRAGVWFYPFRLEQYYFSGKFLANVEKELPYFFLYKEGRLDYLQGEYEEAIARFGKLMKSSLPQDLKEDIYYFQALTHLEKGDRDKARSLFEQYLKEYPEGRWKNKVEKLISN